MDYCHPCGRHLNGALACAGCGTPVEELRHHSPRAPEPDHVYELDVVTEPAESTGPRRSRRQAPSRRKPAGRRARKRRGRKVMLGTLGLVLAAGALSLAELAMEDSGDDGAATAVKEDPVVESEIPDPTASDESPDAPGHVKEPAVTKSSSPRPGKSRGGGGGDGEGDGGPGRTGSDAGSGEPSEAGPSGDGSPSASSSGDPGSSEEPGSTDGTSSDPDDPEEPGQQDPPPPPEPTPSETCSRFLFWCV
ncbi:hypothetical protein GCM10010271_21710 [Streptomyces kurssanovii]|nr:hypothetical protein GCM10010271_21710 [Streptomyces kurssanovii]